MHDEQEENELSLLKAAQQGHGFKNELRSSVFYARPFLSLKVALGFSWLAYQDVRIV